MILGKKNIDQGRVLENIVYLELLCRGYNVSVGHLVNGGIDFVAQNADGIEYFQVSASVLDQSTLERELSSFNKISDNYPKTLLTLDEIGNRSNHNGIRQLYALDWLLV